MAKTFTAPFAQTPKTGFALVTAALGTPNGNTPTGTSLIATAGTDGALLTAVSALPMNTVSATSLFLYVRRSTDGATIRNNVDNVAMPAYTWATTTATPVTKFPTVTVDTPLRLAAGDEVHVGIGVALAAGIQFKAEFTDF